MVSPSFSLSCAFFEVLEGCLALPSHRRDASFDVSRALLVDKVITWGARTCACMSLPYIYRHFFVGGGGEVAAFIYALQQVSIFDQQFSYPSLWRTGLYCIVCVVKYM